MYFDNTRKSEKSNKKICFGGVQKIKMLLGKKGSAGVKNVSDIFFYSRPKKECRFSMIEK